MFTRQNKKAVDREQVNIRRRKKKTQSKRKSRELINEQEVDGWVIQFEDFFEVA